MINNQWVDPVAGGSFETVDPATGEVIAKVAAGDAADVDKAVAAARRALDSPAWRDMDAAERGDLIFRLAELVEQNADELAELEAYKPARSSATRRGDVAGVVNTLRYYAGWADKIEGRTVPVRGGYLSYTLRQPVGVVGQIIPWNFPLLMLAWKWGPALACGNAIVLKPAEQTPLTALRVGQLAIEAGFPAGVVNIVNGLGETAGAAMCRHPGIDKIAFTGHVDTAKIIQNATADTLKRTTFELGGKSPNVVFADADLDDAVAGAFHAIYFHGGQCCTAGSRLFVEQKIHTRVRRAIGREGPQTPRWRSARSGRRARPASVAGAARQDPGLRRAGRKAGRRAGGRRPACRGARAISSSRRSSTTCATTWPSPRDEIFGPVVSVLPFKTMDEVTERANNTSYGLAAAIWTKNIDKAHLFAR